MRRKNSVKALKIATFLKAKLFGKDVDIKKVASIGDLEEGALCFVRKFDERYVDALKKCGKCFVVCTDEYKGKINCSYVVSDDPGLDFSRAVKKFFYEQDKKGVINKKADIDKKASIGKGVGIGAYSVIGPEVKIGDDTVIHENVVIKGRVVIGKGCTIKSGAVIGEEGFGFEYDEFGSPEHFTHIGGIQIGDNVWIGAGSTIEIAHIDSTVIKDNVKIDDLVQVGHNCLLGKNSIVAAGTIICGAVTVGENCWVAPNCSIKEKLKIGDGSLVGLGSVVINDVQEKTVVAGNPAKILRTIDKR
ncbi:MAG TPA: UDP-3-O-(3-hydroxymyristoyl)glucosamine N-acyltransferase [Candidatus Omnitrophota bacterium]|nr:UDP-3-O-(3-hydroxymyristoyl)glucosamine N-acyltransferase [Candidatus Omnitrophota bacterium]HPS19534.1 UDP-3-O-(3-hydroxymyristoyl)glucosamine N-acyltransferase [Candidatus Omnitrophota bacterium]